MHSAQEVGYNPQKSTKKSAPERSASGRITVLWVDLTVFDSFVGNDFPFRVGCDLGVRTGVGVLHAAAQLKEDLIQRIGSPLLQLGSDGGIGLLPQGGALALLG